MDENVPKFKGGGMKVISDLATSQNLLDNKETRRLG